VLQTACEKRNLKSELYGLEYNKKPLNLSSTIMLENIPNSAKVDLIQISVENPNDYASVTLKLESGGKLTELFKPDVTLWDMLNSFQDELKSPGKFTNPSKGKLFLIIDGKEYSEENEMIKSLGSIGINAGSKATIQATFRDVTDSSNNLINSNLSNNSGTSNQTQNLSQPFSNNNAVNTNNYSSNSMNTNSSNGNQFRNQNNYSSNSNSSNQYPFASFAFPPINSSLSSSSSSAASSSSSSSSSNYQAADFAPIQKFEVQFKILRFDQFLFQ
jgi:hypothetical protein